jgi:hypothetical protein
VKLAVFLFLGALAFAGDAPKPLSEVQVLKLQNAWYRVQLATVELEKIRGESQAIYSGVCKEAGIEFAQCEVDLNKRVVSRKEPIQPAPNPGAAAPEKK